MSIAAAGMDIQQVAAALGIEYDPARKEEYDEEVRRVHEEFITMIESETPAQRMARYETNQIEEMLREGIPALCVAQLARDIGFKSDEALHFVERELSGATELGPQSI